MNKKNIMLIGMIFCGSFGITAAEAPLAVFKQEKTGWSTLGEKGEWIPDMRITPITLTAEGKKIYDDLIAKYTRKELTSADNTKKNLNVLDYQKEILSKSRNYWPEYLPQGMMTAKVLIGNLSAAAFLDYTGRFRHNLLNYLAGETQSSPLRSIDNFLATGTSVGIGALLTATSLYFATPYIGRIHNFFYSKRNEKIEKEIALIDGVIKTLQASSIE